MLEAAIKSSYATQKRREKFADHAWIYDNKKGNEHPQEKMRQSHKKYILLSGFPRVTLSTFARETLTSPP